MESVIGAVTFDIWAFMASPPSPLPIKENSGNVIFVFTIFLELCGLLYSEGNLGTKLGYLYQKGSVEKGSFSRKGKNREVVGERKMEVKRDQ